MKIFFWFCLCFFAVFSSLLLADDDDNQPKTITKTSASTTGQPLIFLDKATQLSSGLKTIHTSQVSYRSELLSYGTAISVEPLLSIQNQYLNALAQQSTAKAKADFTQHNFNRLNYLQREGIVSNRALQDQQTTMQADKAALDSSYYLRQQIVNNARLVWGETLTGWMLNNPVAFRELIQQHTILLKITFPPDSGITSALKTIFVAPTGHREQAVAAELISSVPQTDSFSQAQQYFYQIPAKQIKAGMRVSAWIPVQQHRQTGVIIPESALVWHLGQALVFVKVADQQFSHRSVASYHKVAGGYFVSTALKAGEELVSTGAQMLLSQEFRGQIPSEDDD